MKQLLNDGWAFRAKANVFAELTGAGLASWQAVTLPHDALIGEKRDPTTSSASGFFPGGRFEYRKALDFGANEPGKRVTLVFDGVYREARVYVNRALAGQEASGYGRFQVRIDPYLRFDQQDEVIVECRTHRDSRWYAGAGIYRDVQMLVQDAYHIAADSVRITALECDPDLAVVEVAATIRNDSNVTKTVRLVVRALDAEGDCAAKNTSPVTLLPADSSTVRLRLYFDRPRLWNLDSPALYDAHLSLETADGVRDADVISFGIRTLQLDPKRGLRINGRPVKLRGACIHHDNGVIGAAAIARAEERRVELLKRSGFNAIRSAHNPISAALLDACDRHGVLVMDELSDVWTESKSDFDSSFAFSEGWERDVEAMVARNYNHPSVIMYSVGNEIRETGTPQGAIWSRRIAEKVRALDPSRYVTNGINLLLAIMDEFPQKAKAPQEEEGEKGINATMESMRSVMDTVAATQSVSLRTEEAMCTLDIAGMNYGHGRYSLDRDLFPNRIIVGTETLPPAIDAIWALVKEHSHVIGDFTWTGWDYLGEAGLGRTQYSGDEGGFYGDYPWLAAAVGDIDILGQRRPMSHYREIVFGLASGPYIAVHRPTPNSTIRRTSNWSLGDQVSSWSWGAPDALPLKVEVFADAEAVELFLNGVSLGYASVGENKAYRADFEVPFQRGVLEAVAYVNGEERGRHRLVSSGDQVLLKVEADRLTISDLPSDLAFIEISLVDDDGTLHVQHDRLVNVAISGPGALQGLGSACPRTEASFVEATTMTFDGRALAVVRPTGRGDIVVTVSAEGCQSRSITIVSKPRGL